MSDVPRDLTLAPDGAGPATSPLAAIAPDERALVARLKAGDEDAFTTVVRDFGPRLLSVARRFVLNDEDARDVLQEAFVSAWRGIGAFAGTSRLSTWLHRIVVSQPEIGGYAAPSAFVQCRYEFFQTHDVRAFARNRIWFSSFAAFCKDRSSLTNCRAALAISSRRLSLPSRVSIAPA